MPPWHASASNPTRRLIVLAIAIALACFHLALAARLGSIHAILARTLEDDEDNGGEDGDWRKLEAINLLVSVARLSSVASGVITSAGAVGVARDLVTPVRVMLLNSFLSLGVELVLLAVTSLVVFSSMSSSSFSAALCEALAHSEITGSFDLLGWSLEACEEKWKGIATALSGFVAAIALVRLWVAHQILSYYTQMVKRSRRATHALGTNPAHLYVDFPSSPSSLSSPSSPTSPRTTGHRIFLLPAPLEVGSQPLSKPTSTHLGTEEVPLVSVTPSSPLSSFPPTLPPADSPGDISKSGQRFLVYAPVMMTAEQARSLQAQEVVYASPPSPRARSRSHTLTLTSSSPTSANTRTGGRGETSPSRDGVGFGPMVGTTSSNQDSLHHMHAHLPGKGKVA